MYKVDSEGEEIAEIVDGVTGESFTPEEYAARKSKKSTGKQAGHFIKGPLPVIWIERAGELSKSALLLGLGLFFIQGLNRGGKFKLSPSRLAELGIDRYAKRRGLKQLESAGLIRVESRGSGRVPVVKILIP